MDNENQYKTMKKLWKVQGPKYTDTITYIKTIEQQLKYFKCPLPLKILLINVIFFNVSSVLNIPVNRWYTVFKN